MTLHQTAYSFVNRWNSDENNHLNVQFYFKLFDEADQQFRLMCGLSDTLVGARRVRHVRHHQEMRTGDLITVYSGIAFDGPHMLTAIHEVRNPSTGAVCATAIDGYEPNISTAKALRQRFKAYQCAMPEIAAPRGLSAGPATNRPSLDQLQKADAEPCYRGTVLPRHIGAEGRADDQYALSCCTDGVPHVWERSPLNHAYLSANGLGRVAVEMKLVWNTPLKVGDTVIVVSGFTGVQPKTFSLRHHIFESQTGRHAATLDVVAVAMDLETRKAIALPEEAVRAISKMTFD